MKSSTRQGKPKLVLDTNILVSALIAREGQPAKVFEKLILGEVENNSSKEIIGELKEVFGRKEITKRTTAKARQFILRHYLNNSIQVLPKSRIKVVEHDSDNKFLEVAVEAKAQFIITGDQHLLKLKKFNEIKIITAKQFMESDRI